MSQPYFKKPRIYIAYYHKDRAGVAQLYSCLDNKGFKCYFDQRDEKYGENINEIIQNELEASSCVICCISTQALTSAGYFKKELDMSLDQIPRLKFIPLILEPGAETLIHTSTGQLAAIKQHKYWEDPSYEKLINFLKIMFCIPIVSSFRSGIWPTLLYYRLRITLEKKEYDASIRTWFVVDRVRIDSKKATLISIHRFIKEYGLQLGEFTKLMIIVRYNLFFGTIKTIEAYYENVLVFKK